MTVRSVRYCAPYCARAVALGVDSRLIKLSHHSSDVSGLEGRFRQGLSLICFPVGASEASEGSKGSACRFAFFILPFDYFNSYSSPRFLPVRTSPLTTSTRQMHISRSRPKATSRPSTRSRSCGISPFQKGSSPPRASQKSRPRPEPVLRRTTRMGCLR